MNSRRRMRGERGGRGGRREVILMKSFLLCLLTFIAQHGAVVGIGVFLSFFSLSFPAFSLVFFSFLFFPSARGMHDTLFCLLFLLSPPTARHQFISVDARARDMWVLQWRGCFGLFLGICVRSCVSCCTVIL